MRTLVVGDLHFKQPLILPTVSQAIAEHGVGRVVFCGDLCDDPLIWCCDTFSTFQDRRPMGDWSMLLVEDGCIRPIEG